MTVLIADQVYNWSSSKNGVVISATSGGACTILQSTNEGVTFEPVGALPLPGGELQGLVDFRNCFIKVTGVTGTITAKPDLRLVE